MSEDIRAKILDELKDVTKSLQQRARQLSRVGDEQNAKKAAALAFMVSAWAKEWE